MSSKPSQPKVHEVTDENRFVPVASPQYLLSQLLDRISALEEREERLAALEEENRALKVELATFREEVALERAHDRKRITDLEKLAETEARDAARARQRISKLEAPAPVLGQKTAEDHIDRLFLAMRSQGVKQTTTKGAARLLGVSKPLIDKIKPYLATDSRFVILRDPNHKQRHIIRLAGT